MHAVSVCNTKRYTLSRIIHETVMPDSIVYTDTYSSYDIVDASHFHHERVNHSREFVNDERHINGIENFWNQAKRYLRKYNRIPAQHFDLFLKECEWRFNYQSNRKVIQDVIYLV